MDEGADQPVKTAGSVQFRRSRWAHIPVIGRWIERRVRRQRFDELMRRLEALHAQCQHAEVPCPCWCGCGATVYAECIPFPGMCSVCAVREVRSGELHGMRERPAAPPADHADQP